MKGFKIYNLKSCFIFLERFEVQKIHMEVQGSELTSFLIALPQKWLAAKPILTQPLKAKLIVSLI
jgi:hypothetical protein